MRQGSTLVCVLLLLLGACTTLPAVQEANAAVLLLRSYGSWAWALGVVLIWADVILPIPQTAVIAALGIVYGPLLGGLLGSVGLVTGGLLGYGLMFTAARRRVQRLIGSRWLQQMQGAFERAGAWVIILTRSLPYSIAEMAVFVAGLAGMPLRTFVTVLILGCVPTAFVFAAIGAGWAQQPIVAVAVSYLLPIALLPVVLRLLRLSR